MDRGLALILTVLAGGLIAVQPPANAMLGRVVGDLGAAFVSLTFSAALVGVLLLAFGDPGQLSNITGFKPEHLLGGISGAAIVVVTLITVRPLGAAAITAAILGAQLSVSAVLDRYGILGLEKIPLGWKGWAGIALLAGGTFLMTTR